MTDKMNANDRAKLVLDLLRAHPNGLTADEIRREVPFSGRQALDAIAKLVRDNVLASVLANTEAAKVWRLKANAVNYEPKPRGSFT